MPDQFSLLLEWRRNEAASRSLAKLPHDFYATTRTYLADVRRSYEADLRENPSGRKGEISRQTYQRAGQAARDIVEGRIQKVMAAAFQSSIGGPRDLPNALPEERAVFDGVLGALVAHRKSVAPYLEGPGSAAAAASEPRPAVEHAPLPGKSSPPTVVPRPGASTVYVRIVKEARPIEVGSETIDLRPDDVLSLPPETARILVEAKIAEPVKTGPVRSPVT
jgi:DNA replication initiation complex subunit (GINS family)